MSARLQTPADKNNLPAHVLRKAVVFKPTSATPGGVSGGITQTDAADRAAEQRLVRQRRMAKDSQNIAASHRIANSSAARGHYTGAELKPYSMRIGALDFLALPSLMGNRRIYRADQIHHMTSITESTI